MTSRLDVGGVLDFRPHYPRMGPNGAVKGHFQQQMFHVLDHFNEYTDAKFWTAGVGNGGNVPAVIASANGAINIITNGITADVTELYGTTAILTGRQGVTIEARFKAALVTSVCLNFGVVNAASLTNDLCAFTMGAADAVTIGTNVTDGACFVYDTGSATDKWFCVSTKASAAAQSALIASSVAPVNAVYEVFRIDVDTSGNATFYRNGIIEGRIDSALTNTVALRPYISVLTNTGTARSVTPDYIEMWQSILESSTVLW